MSRIKTIMDRIDDGVKNGYISEEERKDFLGTRISSKYDLDRLEEAVEQAMNVSEYDK
jgi:hypothetical protein